MYSHRNQSYNNICPNDYNICPNDYSIAGKLGTSICIIRGPDCPTGYTGPIGYTGPTGYTGPSSSIPISPYYSLSGYIDNYPSTNLGAPSATISSIITLSGDAYYENLTLSGGELRSNGYRIYVNNTLTFNGGSITNNGNDGTIYAGGAATNMSGTLGYGTSGGNPGLQGTDHSNGLGNVSGYFNGGNSDVELPGQVTQTIIDESYLKINPVNLLLQNQLGVKIYGGCGGAGVDDNAAGGGGGGGVISIYARNIIYNSGIISAVGGSGVNTGATRSGGGGGGVILVVTNNVTNPSGLLLNMLVDGGGPGPGYYGGGPGPGYYTGLPGKKLLIIYR